MCENLELRRAKRKGWRNFAGSNTALPLAAQSPTFIEIPFAIYEPRRPIAEAKLGAVSA
jgi:hypothetical protein